MLVPTCGNVPVPGRPRVGNLVFMEINCCRYRSGDSSCERMEKGEVDHIGDENQVGAPTAFKEPVRHRDSAVMHPPFPELTLHLQKPYVMRGKPDQTVAPGFMRATIVCFNKENLHCYGFPPGRFHLRRLSVNGYSRQVAIIRPGGKSL